MPEKIKGFSIELELDALKVDSGLKDVRKSISAMNSEMRRKMSVFDFGEKSVKKYQTQLDGLNKKLELQRDIVEKARKHYEKMVETHGAGSKEALQAATAYNNEVASLNNLERHIQKVTQEMKEFERQQAIKNSTLYKSGEALVNFGDKLGSISGIAKDVGRDLTKYVTTPIAGLVSLVGGLGFKRAMDLEQVELMMRHMSDSAQEYEKRMQNVIDLVTDTRFGTAELGAEYAKFISASASDASAMLYSKVAMNLASFRSDDQLIPQIGDLFTKALQSGKIDGTMINQFTNAGVDILKTLGNVWGMETEQVRKRLREGNFDIEEVLNELSIGILEGTDGINGATKAMGGMLELSGRTLSGQIKNFWAAIAIRGEKIIKETGLFDGVKDALDELRDMLKSGEFDSILLPTFEGLAKALEALVDIARKFFKWFSSLDDSTKRWIGNLVGLSVIIGPLLVGLGTFGGIIAKLSTSMGNFLKWLAPIFKPMSKFGLVAGEAGQKVGLLSRGFTFLTGPAGIVIGILTALATAFIVAYKRSETFRNFVHDLGDKLKETFFGIVDWIKPGFDAVVSFFGEIKEKIAGFINEEGPGFLEAWRNIFGFIAPILQAIWGAIKWVFDKIKWIIADFVMPVVEFVIKQVWGNIKGIITGTLDVIMGAVKIFSGLFTGDFSKMWEGVKQLFFGAIQVVWNWIQLQFIGRILKGVGGLAKGFWGHIKNMWQWVKNTFTNSISTVYNGVKNSFVGRIIKSITTMKSRFISIAKDMWSGVKKQFDKIVDGAKALPGRIGKGIRNAKDKATDGMKSVGNSIIRWAGKPFNKVVDGVNWITGKLGVDKKIAKWDYPQYAKGTDKKGHPGGWAMVGEEGRELIQLPSGKSIISPDSHTMMNLPKGTHVIPNKPTEKILKSDLPHYAKGTGLWEGIKDVWDYISNPSKLVDSVMNKINIASNLAAIPKAIVSGGFNYLKTKPYEYIKKLFSESGGGGKPAFGWPITSPFGYRIHPITGQRKLHGGVDFGAPMGAPVPSTTAGRVSYAGYGWNGGFGNLVKIKQGIWEMFYAHLSKILVKAGQSVKKGQIIGLVGSTGASTGPHLHYETRKNGVRVNPMSLKGFATGGLVKSKMLAMLGEDGEEMVIPLSPNRRTDAMKLLALAAKKIGADDGSFVRPNNIFNGDNNNKEIEELKEMIRLLQEQNEHSKKMIELLIALLGKDLDLYKLNKKVDEGLNNLSSRRNAAWGGNA